MMYNVHWMLVFDFVLRLRLTLRQDRKKLFMQWNYQSSYTTS